MNLIIFHRDRVKVCLQTSWACLEKGQIQEKFNNILDEQVDEIIILDKTIKIELLTEKETRDWLDIAAHNPEKGILYQIKKHKIGERWQKRTKHVKLSNLKALIIDNDEMELLPEEKINKDLSFLAGQMSMRNN